MLLDGKECGRFYTVMFQKMQYHYTYKVMGNNAKGFT